MAQGPQSAVRGGRRWPIFHRILLWKSPLVLLCDTNDQKYLCKMSTLILTNSEEAIQEYCWTLRLVVLAGRTAGYIWADLSVRERKIICIYFALVWVNFHWLLSCVRGREKPRETAGRKTMGLHCISSKSSPVIPSTSQRIRSYIKLLLRNKSLQNLSHMVQKASPSLHYADLKAAEKIQINCHCPSCKAEEW